MYGSMRGYGTVVPVKEVVFEDMFFVVQCRTLGEYTFAKK